jgi:hypothetical protein
MSSDRQTRFREHHNRRVRQLRSNINSLPDELRPQFQEWLDEKNQQCLQIQEAAQSTRNIAGDLALAAAHAAFHLEVTWREVNGSC